ncbi:hypothetical protein EXIGLDRAFT_783672 [Exidia glandulosa HHB12029]|uniref:Uncharacterized protein n=1 Tax=Exidia glandulosa HHB12029 TaxID=1314781 RepID=A0A166MXQ8_EXIGL|nr:hypothetical protein EXIGLDRAFT_783672 [Exidia glandulosa HHB12029]
MHSSVLLLNMSASDSQHRHWKLYHDVVFTFFLVDSDIIDTDALRKLSDHQR